MAVTAFGHMADGRVVQAVDLRAGGLAARVLTLGSALQDLRLDGGAHGLTLGLPTVADYEAPEGGYFGTLVGPVANRLAGATAPLGAGHLRLDPNEGPNLLHSGPRGLHGRLWRVAEAAPDTATLTLDLADGEDGFPGNRRLVARWTALPPTTLQLDLTVETDAPTFCNIANHSYWNLDGTGTWDGHSLRLVAEGWLPTDAAGLPTGEVAAMTGAMNFTAARRLRPGEPPLDHNFCVARGRRGLTPVLWLTGQSGLALELATTEPGVQVYDGRAAVRPGRAPYEGIAIEAQGWPDAPNRPGFPQITIAPGAPYRQITEWRFSRG